MLDEKILQNARQIHFIGIGGSGMFPLVQIMQQRGYKITGSDNNESDTLALERAMGHRCYAWAARRKHRWRGFDRLYSRHYGR